jgi:hypothetical protein
MPQGLVRERVVEFEQLEIEIEIEIESAST